MLKNLKRNNMITEFQKGLTEKLESGELPYAEASIYTVLLSLVQSSSLEEVFVMLHNVACDLDKREALEEMFEDAKLYNWI